MAKSWCRPSTAVRRRSKRSDGWSVPSEGAVTLQSTKSCHSQAISRGLRLRLRCRLYLFHSLDVRRAKPKQDGARPMTTANEIAEKIAAENDLTKAQAK